ncbi:TPA: hypothetical protein EYP84_00315 [Candidatus Bipolaricaulota bacterium]|nr:hypothetical protein [Candidatus Bipolaricaulota bacterium]HIP99025.1 hypothetical protein [Candidatus Bipolaricaulota bacterium]
MNSTGEVVWEYASGLQFPHDAELDPSGQRLLVADTDIEVSPEGELVWQFFGLNLPDEAELLHCHHPLGKAAPCLSPGQG